MAATYVAPSTKRLAVRAARVRSKPWPEMNLGLIITAAVSIMVTFIVGLTALIINLIAAGLYQNYDGSIDWTSVHNVQFESSMWVLGNAIIMAVAIGYLVHLPRRIWSLVGACYGDSICQVPEPLIAAYDGLMKKWLDGMHVAVAAEVRRHMRPVWVVMAHHQEIIGPDAHLAVHLAPDAAVLAPTSATIAGKYQATGLEIAAAEIEALRPFARQAQDDLELSDAGIEADAKFMH